MLKICEISIVMHRGRNTMQKYLDLKGGPFQEGQEQSSYKPCTGNSQNCNDRERNLFVKKKDNLNM